MDELNIKGRRRSGRGRKLAQLCLLSKHMWSTVSLFGSVAMYSGGISIKEPDSEPEMTGASGICRRSDFGIATQPGFRTRTRIAEKRCSGNVLEYRALKRSVLEYNVS